MLSDHIVFWMKHKELPAFTSTCEMLMYEWNCFPIHFVAGLKAMAEAMRRLRVSTQDATRLMTMLQQAAIKADQIKRK